MSAGPVPDVVTPQMTDPNSTQLYINNLSFSTTPESLTAFFSSRLGFPASDVNIVTNARSGRSKGFGFVRVPNEKVQAALSLNGSMLDEREVGVVEARERTEEERQEQRDRRDARRKEIADKRREEKAAAAAANPASATSPSGGLATSTSEAPRPRRARAERKVYDNATQLWVSNLSFDITRERLQQVVEEAIGADAVLEVDVVMRREAKGKVRSRGYGFVTVSNEQLEKALLLNDQGRRRQADRRPARQGEEGGRRQERSRRLSTAASLLRARQWRAGDGRRPSRRRRGGGGGSRINGGGEAKDGEAPPQVEGSSVSGGLVRADAGHAAQLRLHSCGRRREEEGEEAAAWWQGQQRQPALLDRVSSPTGSAGRRSELMRKEARREKLRG